MADYLADGDVKALRDLARSIPPGFLDALAAVGQLGRSTEALALEVLSLRQRAQGDAMQLTRYAQTVREKDGELELAYAKITALEARVTKLVAA